VAAYAILDVEIYDPVRYDHYLALVAPALEAAGARYLAKGEATVYEGDWVPRRFVLLEFPSKAHAEIFYNCPLYQSLKAMRDECSSARLVGIEGL